MRGLSLENSVAPPKCPLIAGSPNAQNGFWGTVAKKERGVGRFAAPRKKMARPLRLERLGWFEEYGIGEFNPQAPPPSLPPLASSSSPMLALGARPTIRTCRAFRRFGTWQEPRSRPPEVGRRGFTGPDLNLSHRDLQGDVKGQQKSAIHNDRTAPWVGI